MSDVNNYSTLLMIDLLDDLWLDAGKLGRAGVWPDNLGLDRGLADLDRGLANLWLE